MSEDLAGIVDSFRWRTRTPAAGPPASAFALYQADPDRRAFVSGAQVADAFGQLLHFTSSAAFSEIKRTGKLGNPGVYLTPTPYAGWQASAELGLSDLFDRCLLVDVSDTPKLWGPGAALLDRVRVARRRHGVLGSRADPVRTGHAGIRVRRRPRPPPYRGVKALNHDGVAAYPQTDVWGSVRSCSSPIRRLP
jgi:hypothetical protein